MAVPTLEDKAMTVAAITTTVFIAPARDLFEVKVATRVLARVVATRFLLLNRQNYCTATW